MNLFTFLIYLSSDISYTTILILNYESIRSIFRGRKSHQDNIKIGFIPKEEDFEEFSESDYEKYHKEVGETEGKMFRFVQGKMDESEYVFAFDEFEKEKLLEGSEVIRNLADDHLSDSDDETLQYVARVMPYPFTKGTKYEKKNPK